MLNVVSFSGGKDSTAMLLMMLEKGIKIDYILCCDTGMEFPEMYEHWKRVDEYIKQYGKHITYLKSEKSFEYYFKDHVRKKGKYAGVKGYGWPSAMRRWCTGYLKTNVIEKFKKELEEEITDYIGIAYDEQKRIKNKHYPLVEWGITEKMALQYCYNKGFDWGGLYENFRRASCYLCPLKRLGDWRTLRHKYPELWKKALWFDGKSCYQFKPDYSLHDLESRFAQEDLQTVLNF